MPVTQQYSLLWLNGLNKKQKEGWQARRIRAFDKFSRATFMIEKARTALKDQDYHEAQLYGHGALEMVAHALDHIATAIYDKSRTISRKTRKA